MNQAQIQRIDRLPNITLTPWHDYSLSSLQALPLDNNMKADVLIISVNITHLIAALTLAEQGARVSIVDGHENCSLDFSNGFILPGLDVEDNMIASQLGAEKAEHLIAFAEAAPRAVSDIVESYHLLCEHRCCGHLLAAHNWHALNNLEQRHQTLTQRGIATSYYNRDQTVEELGCESYYGGLLDPRGGAIDPLRYKHELARAACAAGVTIYSHDSHFHLARSARGWSLTAPHGKIIAEQIILSQSVIWPDIRPILRQSTCFYIATGKLDEGEFLSILPSNIAASDTRIPPLSLRKISGERLLFSRNKRSWLIAKRFHLRKLTLESAKLFPRAVRRPVPYAWFQRLSLPYNHLPHIYQPAPTVFTIIGNRGIALASATGLELARLVGGAQDSPLPFLPTSSTTSQDSIRVRLS